MIYPNPRNSNHEPMQLLHYKIPMTTNFEQPSSSIYENFRLLTTTQVSGSISLSVPQLIFKPNPTLLNINILSIALLTSVTRTVSRRPRARIMY